MDKETYGHINVMWWCSLVIGIWCIIAYMLNQFVEMINSVDAWNDLYPSVFPLMMLLSIFGFVITSQYKMAVRFGWIKLKENLKLR